MARKVIKEVKCLRCEYKWFPRAPTQPKRCARCRTPYWYKPIVRKSVSEANKRRHTGGNS